MEQQIDIVMASLRSFMFDLGSFLPMLIGAVAILIVGWLVSKLLQFIVVRGLKGMRFHELTVAAGLDDFLKKGGVRSGTVDVLGVMVYWLAILMTLLTTFNVLFAAKESLALGGPRQGGEDPQQSGLPCSVRSVDEDGLARLDAQADLPQRGEVAKILGDVAEFQAALSGECFGWHTTRRVQAGSA